ncbi:MAG: STAS domain-containing protein [Coriobacteriia bacterium]|nr:STAS domain-containing protein [Coriobacteriia bacterium]
MDLAVVTSQRAGIPVLAFSGDLDGILVDEFERAVIETAQESCGSVIVDLGGVTYIDSQAFGRLLKAHVVLETSGGDIAIASSGADVTRIIRTFGADYLLGVFDDVDSAAAYLQPLIPHD